METTTRRCHVMITDTLEHLVECLDECVLGMNRLCFLNELNSKLSVPNPEIDEGHTPSSPSAPMHMNMPQIC